MLTLCTSFKSNIVLVAYQRNKADTNEWKQQLQSYQETNEVLSNKLGALSALYDQMGEVMKQ